MKSFVVHETKAERLAWIYPDVTGGYEPAHGEPDEDRLAVQIRHVGPRGRDAYRRKLLKLGVMRKVIKHGMETTVEVDGKEDARDRLFCETFVSGWRGFLDEAQQALPFTAAALAALMADEVWLNKAIALAVEEFDSFFGVNGNASSGG